MKKFYVLLAATMMAASAGAQGWTKSINALTSENNPYYGAPVITTSDKGVVVAGCFDQTVTFGDASVETPVASSYVAKYSSEGAELWITAIEGAATVRTVCEMADGKIVVGGVFAGEITIGTTTLQGTVNGDGDFIARQLASFVAVLGADGSAVNAKAYVPTINSVISGTEMWYDDNYSFIINNVSAKGNDILVCGLLNGQVSLAGSTVSSGVQDVFGSMYNDLTSAVVFSTSADLTSENVIATVKTTGDDPTEAVSEVLDVKVAVSGNDVVLGTIITGDVTIAAGASSEDITLAYDGEGNNEFAYAITKISDNVSTTTYKATTSKSLPYELTALHVAGDDIYVGGIFKDANPFDNTKVAVGTYDMFIAHINAGNVDVVTSNYTEGEENQAYEYATALDVNGRDVTLYGYICDKDHVLSSGATLSISGTFKHDGTSVITCVNDYATASYNIGGGAGYEQTVTYDKNGRVAVEKPQAIGQKTAVYDLTGRALSVANKGLYILNGKKVVF